ncbi:MAG: hypothetical protein EBQ78_00195, partial [Betaproteobacteria bacterium]|nr:hypothetical protein [Betaproteobacteria bacterium]
MAAAFAGALTAAALVVADLAGFLADFTTGFSSVGAALRAAAGLPGRSGRSGRGANSKPILPAGSRTKK